MRRVFSFHVLFLLSSSLLSFGAQAESATSVQTWNRWEQSLTSTEPYENPCKDVVLKVVYSGPDGKEIHAYGFWDGDRTFKIRCMFPTAGKWQWQTECSNTNDSGLHHQQGEIQVTAYAGSNSLYNKGYLCVSENRRYLTFADGTPFLWIGDTAWAAPMHASMDEWQTYIQDRSEKHFSILQIFCSTTSWTGTKVNRNGHPPFIKKGISQWNPAYWRDYEELVQYANQQGMVVLIVGLMEPTERYPNVEDAKIFARNLAARLMGNFVIYSPSFDSPYMELGKAVGEVVRKTTSMHLITQHTGTDLNAAQRYYDESYLDFCGLQSGAGWGSNPISSETAAKNAVDWTLDLYHRSPWKPVINLETRYDSAFNQKQVPRMPRSCGYWTLLSGAKGYTYGCAGVWFWGVPITDNDPQADASWNLQTGMAQPSSMDMKYMADFFQGIPWWKLEPAHDWIVNQGEKSTQHMVLACTPEKDLVVAYLPDNERIEIRSANFPGPFQAYWFNPQTGEYVVVEHFIQREDVYSFVRTDHWEDALLVLSKSSEN